MERMPIYETLKKMSFTCCYCKDNVGKICTHDTDAMQHNQYVQENLIMDIKC